MKRRTRWVLSSAWALAVITLMAATARYLRDSVNNVFLLRSAGVSQRAHSSLQESLERQVGNLGDLAEGLGQDAGLDETSFQEKAVRFLRDAPMFSAVTFLNEKFNREWVFPFSATQGTLGTEMKTHSDASATAQRSIETGRPAASGLVSLLQGGAGILVYAPVFRSALWGGLVEGPVQIARVAMDLIEPSVGLGFHYAIIDERQGREIYSTLTPADRARTPAYDAYFTLPMADRNWWVVLHPPTTPPALAIVAGALSAEAVMGALIYYLWRRRR
ncbi:MAG: CHASE domain-containing protein [Elusimicrobia bacterium]|nr:CHASE domain-containing protein [Elusimicrobiota bacterium]